MALVVSPHTARPVPQHWQIEAQGCCVAGKSDCNNTQLYSLIECSCLLCRRHIASAAKSVYSLYAADDIVALLVVLHDTGLQVVFKAWPSQTSPQVRTDAAGNAAHVDTHAVGLVQGTWTRSGPCTKDVDS